MQFLGIIRNSPWLHEVCALVIGVGLMLLVRACRIDLTVKWCEVQVRRLVRHRGWTIAFVVAVVMFLHVVAGLLIGVSAPKIHDEFSYLLAADTFAHGRVTNPVHPMWEHFETFHVVQQPTYQSKYPPVQGVLLAIGEVITGVPLVGGWMGMALAAGAICWMLQGCMPCRWALAGGLIFGLHRHLFWDWGQTYWGGAGAAIGSALFFGAIFHLMRVRRKPERRRVLLMLVMAIGVVILANSRPFEGMICALAVMPFFICWTVRQGVWSVVYAGIPGILVILVSACLMLAYNKSITGNVWTMPHQVYEQAYSSAPIFYWQNLRQSPVFRHDVFRKFDEYWARSEYSRGQGVASYLTEVGRRMRGLWVFYLGILPSFVLMGLLFCGRKRGVKIAIIVCVVLLCSMQAVSYAMMHYAAPIIGLVLLLCLTGARAIWGMRWAGHDFGKFLLKAGFLAWVILFLLSWLPRLTDHDYSWSSERQKLCKQLGRDGKRHLVIVRYGTAHIPDCEWVYNSADIDSSPVIWCRDMGAERNQEIVDYFHGRKIHLLVVNNDRVRPEMREIDPAISP